MKLGILVSTDRHLGDVVGIARAAADLGHEVEIFCMDAGVRLLGEDSFSALSALKGIGMSYCDLSVRRLGLPKAGMPGAIIAGSQFNNARMAGSCDRVINL